MIKKSLPFIFLFSLFAIILSSVTFAMDYTTLDYAIEDDGEVSFDETVNEEFDVEYQKPQSKIFKSKMGSKRRRRPIKIANATLVGLTAIILKLTKPVVKKVDNKTLTLAHDVLDDIATVSTAFSILNNTNNKIKVGWKYTATLAVIVAASKTNQAKKIEEMIYLDRLNKMYPWLPNVLSGFIAGFIRNVFF